MCDLLNYIYVQPPILILIWIVALVTLWSIMGYTQKSRVWKILNLIILTTSILAILYATIHNRRDIGLADVILIPFHSFIEGQTQPEKYREMLMNEFLFVPFGLTALFALSRLKRLRSVVITVGAATGASPHIIALWINCCRNKCSPA